MKRDCNKYKKTASRLKRASLCFSFFFFFLNVHLICSLLDMSQVLDLFNEQIGQKLYIKRNIHRES